MAKSKSIWQKKVPTRLGYLLIAFFATFCAFVIVKVVADLPTSHISPIFTPRFGSYN